MWFEILACSHFTIYAAKGKLLVLLCHMCALMPTSHVRVYMLIHPSCMLMLFEIVLAKVYHTNMLSMQLCFPRLFESEW